MFTQLILQIPRTGRRDDRSTMDNRHLIDVVGHRANAIHTGWNIHIAGSL